MNEVINSTWIKLVAALVGLQLSCVEGKIYVTLQ